MTFIKTLEISQERLKNKKKSCFNKIFVSSPWGRDHNRFLFFTEHAESTSRILKSFSSQCDDTCGNMQNNLIISVSKI